MTKIKFTRPKFKNLHSVLSIIAITSLPFGLSLYSETSVVESYKKQETNLSQKRFEQKKWTGKQQSDLMQKTFPFKQWNSHYSSLGSKKWNVPLEETKDKKSFKTGVVDFPTKEMELSEWQGKLARLESQAQISTDSTARLIQDKRTYEMVLQQAENYSETGEKLSLRDINRFQFRKNRSDGDVPVTKAGSGN